ncbi:SGNH/GDSL hydrolase family protein [Robiginitalea sp.]|uniref:SGNH/GDSL hydrolase family protein n=1 Tax=Robiginitalea sp. TaxID=1902411 RepID=UPI003C5AC7EE
MKSIPYPYAILKKPEQTRVYIVRFLRPLICSLFAMGAASLWGQDPLRFQEEIQMLKHKTDSLWNGENGTLLFTGSSSIRMWEDLQERFPNEHILNTGFGGSQATDLLYYLQPLVLSYKPKKVFIYEGDNDLAEGKRVGQVLKVLENITEGLRNEMPDVSIVIISAKPSISRWGLRGKYKRLNKKLRRWATRHQHLDFVDVWNPMLADKKLNTSLFIEDGLHMNETGYDIWEYALKPYIKP